MEGKRAFASYANYCALAVAVVSSAQNVFLKNEFVTTQALAREYTMIKYLQALCFVHEPISGPESNKFTYMYFLSKIVIVCDDGVEYLHHEEIFRYFLLNRYHEK